MADKLTVDEEGESERGRSNKASVATRLLFLLMGAGVGAVAALLFAPKAGEELRHDIADTTRRGFDRSRDEAQPLYDRENNYEVRRTASVDLGGDETKEGY
jgi:gas vesicle protein